MFYIYIYTINHKLLHMTNMTRSIEIRLSVDWPGKYTPNSTNRSKHAYICVVSLLLLLTLRTFYLSSSPSPHGLMCCPRPTAAARSRIASTVAPPALLQPRPLTFANLCRYTPALVQPNHPPPPEPLPSPLPPLYFASPSRRPHCNS